MTKWLLAPFLLVPLCGMIGAQDEDGPGPLEIKVEDPAALKKGSFAEFTVKEGLITGDKIGWEVTPEPLRAKRYGSVLVVDGAEGVTYTVKVEIINFKKATWKKGAVTYTFGGKTVIPPPKEKEPDEKEPDPKKPDEPVVYYFAVVRPDGAASPAFTKTMQDPAWAQLRLKDHTVKDFTATDARDRLKIDTGAVPLPAVVTLVVARDGKSSFLARPAVPLPTTGADILKLAELK